jgi:hypothetical protein
VTAIRAADTDGNPDTVPNSTWTPLITTPNHPSYGSNHSTQSRAAAEALAAFSGTDQVRFTAESEGVTRSFKKFTDAAKEAGKSRVYAGIHWSFDCAAGEALGRKVGQYVADHYFQPLGASGDGTHGGVLPQGEGAGPGRGHEANGVTKRRESAAGNPAGAAGGADISKRPAGSSPPSKPPAGPASPRRPVRAPG